MSIHDIQNDILAKGGKCVSCGEPFKYGDIDWYEHDGGIMVKESPAPLWVFFSCRKCKYDSVLWKVEKQLGFIQEEIEEIEEDKELDEFVREAQKPKMKELIDEEE